MKKLIKSIIGLLVLATISSGLYYWVVVNSSGTERIKYIEPNKDYNSFSDILQHPDIKGKVVYVDYWHTGCSPCLEEFLHMPKLKEKFQTNKDLVFLYLGKDRSVPGEEFRWKRMIEKKDLTGHHYFLTKEKYKEIWAETVKDTTIMMTFPHYLIVSRDGQILNDSAPRPSDKTLVAELTEALSK